VTLDAAKEVGRSPAGGLVKHGTLLFATSMVANATNYAFRIFMSHRLGTDYRILDALLSVFMIISIPASAIQTATAKYASDLGVGKRYDEIADLFLRSLRRIVLVCLVGLAAFLTSANAVAGYLQIGRTAPVVLLGIALFLALLLPAAVGVLQGLQRFVTLGLMGIGGALVRLGAGVAFVLLGFGVNGAVGASVVSSLAGLLIAFFPLRPFLMRSDERPADSSGVYRYFVPIILFLTCQSLLFYVDSIVVNHYFDQEQAKIYATAAIVGKAFLFLPTALALVLFPKASELYALRESSFRLLIQAILYTLCVAVAGMAVCFLFAGPLSVIVGGGHTPEVAGLIRYFGLAVTPVALLQLLISHAMAVHRTSALYPLAAGTLAFIGVLFVFHETLRQVLVGMGVAGCGLCVLCIVWAWLAERQAAHA